MLRNSRSATLRGNVFGTRRFRVYRPVRESPHPFEFMNRQRPGTVSLADHHRVMHLLGGYVQRLQLENRAAVAAVTAAALVPQRPLYRMCRGPKPPERVEYLWTSFGPEKG